MQGSAAALEPDGGKPDPYEKTFIIGSCGKKAEQ